MPGTYLFRFRDLGKKQGFTVKEHKEIIELHDFVWWGWWAKEGERFPTFDLGTAIENGPLEVFFFDSGQYKFYSSLLVEICSGISGTIPKNSPSEAQTPEYYKDEKCLGWLKLTNLTEIDEERIVRNYSYQKLESLYEKTLGDQDEQLFNKIIFSPKELKKQDRTIWKIREKIPGDFEHESLATHYIPYNFVERFSQRGSPLIAWLSDIHFDDGNGKHSFPFDDNVQHKCLSTRIDQLIREYSSGEKCAGLIVSGDITWQSQEGGFEQAENFIEDISSSQSFTPDDIAICPGNHDVGLLSVEEYEAIHGEFDRENSQRLVEEYHESSKANYINFYKNVFKRAPEENLAQGRKFLLSGQKLVEIASINSCLLQQVKSTFMGVGFVGEDQLKDIASQMGWTYEDDAKIINNPKPKGVLRMCMLHHHLTPVNSSEDAYLDFRYSVTLDAERLMQWIVEHEVDYVLHGHMHKCFATTITRKKYPMKDLEGESKEHSFKVIALGSSGVDIADLPGDDPCNYVCLIDFSGDRPVFNFHRLDKGSNVIKKPDYKVVG
ncbi:metallophosphoesterase [Agarivorans sp. B2Z047]|uniref:metallophosphoesterase family protein n=1 Tax=Agarivorans sp. B2Z047 TaxID=2652721 RepID=UPI00128B988B|nr:metallophosphoesterase [Agarivorans sp. B2Z047]MPW27809.1 metallophosphoesterase [Agarivorans sp. B2Z047]UQN44356.1 metallophosphoesterase [Agarivorans sp. B2Z047]